MKKTLLKTSAVLISFLFLITCFGVLSSKADESDDAKTITGRYFAFDHVISWDYKYSDDYFRQPSDQYNHDFARLSLGMALSSFRDTDHEDNQDQYLVEYLGNMGFEDIETDTYRKEPESDSISYGLARKQVDDFTVLVCAVCGGNYNKEWASNLTVGDGERAEGFEDASLKVQAAIRDYTERHPSESPVKLWLAGYSRAAAVSNITAADLLSSDSFEDIYTYTFATPCTTRAPVEYPNIFNIMQKDDVVPKVPLTDWGYGHYGQDLYFVSPETDSDCEDVMEQAQQNYREMVDSQMIENDDINNSLRIIMDYLLMIMPNPTVYKQYLQPLILDIMARSDETKDALKVLLEALERYSVETDQNREELKALREYLGTVIGVYYLREGIKDLPPEMWDPEFAVANLFNAHFPFEYLSMMFASDDPSELFSDNTEYIQVVIYGIVDADIMDGEKVLKTVLKDGTELVNGEEAPYSLPNVECSSEKTVITLPGDKSYQIRITSRSPLPQTITYTGLRFSGKTVRAQADDFYSYLMFDNDTATIVTALSGRAIEPEASDHTDVSPVIETIYSPTTAMRLENNDVLHLTISGLVNKLLVIIVVLLIQMIVSIVLAIIRVKKKRKRNMTVALVWHSIIAAAFAVIEMAMWYFVPVLPLAKMIPMALVFIVIVVYAFKGYRYHKKGIKTFWILTGILALYDILTTLLLGDFHLIKALIGLIVYGVFIALAYRLLWKRVKDDKGTVLLSPSENQ